MIFVCEKCGKEFESTHKKKYCSNECRINRINEKEKMRKIRKVCPECKKVFWDESDMRFCSNQCRKKSIEKDKARTGFTSLGEKLEYCKRIGITYAQYQIMETMNVKRD